MSEGTCVAFFLTLSHSHEMFTLIYSHVFIFLKIVISSSGTLIFLSTCVCFGVRVLVVYFCMLSVSLRVADLILFWASRCVIPSVLTPSMAEMMSPWARLPPAALLPGVIYRRISRASYTGIKRKHLKTYIVTQRYVIE